METEATIRLRLKSVKPEKIVPHFVEWLSQTGKVEFGKSTPMQEGGFRLGGEPRIRSGIKVPVILNGERIGTLECCINPHCVFYLGERPLDISIPVSRWFRNQKTVLLGYCWDYPIENRWPIPFP